MSSTGRIFGSAGDEVVEVQPPRPPLGQVTTSAPISPFEPPKARLAGDLVDRWKSRQPHAKAAMVLRTLSVIPATMAVISVGIAAADMAVGHHNDLGRVALYTVVLF